MPKRKVETTEVSASVSSSNRVFVTWRLNQASGCVWMDPEQAEAIGAVGRMARMRRDDADSSDGE